MIIAEQTGKHSLILSYPSKVEQKEIQNEKEIQKETKITKKHFDSKIKDTHENDKLVWSSHKKITMWTDLKKKKSVL